MPPFLRGVQQNQHVSAANVSITKDKCLLFCIEGRYECHIFFPSMPHAYIGAGGKEVESQTQHLDHLALGVWTDRVLLPALDAVCDTSTRQHLPTTFEQIRTKAHVKSEVNPLHGSYSQIDVRVPVRPALLKDLWKEISQRAAQVPDTHLPADAFSNPTLFVSSHNSKLSHLGGHPDFETMRAAVQADKAFRWNHEYIRPDEGWVDIGEETCCSIPGSLSYRKMQCNRHFALAFRSHAGRTIETEYITTCTDAGSIQVEPTTRNDIHPFIALGKAYNVDKEQLYTAYKGHSPFDCASLEALSYSKDQVQRFASGRLKGGLPSSVTRNRIIQQYLNTKRRVAAALLPKRAQKASYGVRRELRITMEFFDAIPVGFLSAEHLRAVEGDNRHQPFWILSTAEVNTFRVADANRFLLCLESIISAAEPKRGSKDSILVAEQQRNALMATALVRSLKLLLGCGNPKACPLLWEGKRWVRTRRYASSCTTGTLGGRYSKRQGLEYKESAQDFGMIWLPVRLIEWGDSLPYFRIRKYRHLDVAFGLFNENRVRAAAAEARTYDGKLLQFISFRMESHATDLNPSSIAWRTLFCELAEVCIQQYNLWVWDILRRRWRKHAAVVGITGVSFDDAAGLSRSARNGLEVLSYQTLRHYLVVNLGLPGLVDARASDTDNATFHKWSTASWEGRVSPLFDPGPDQPPWINRSRVGLRIAEIEQRLGDTVGGAMAPVFQAAFRRCLHRLANSRVQAILHYNRSSASTVVKATKDNSQHVQEIRSAQSDLMGTKWMFPRVSRHDLETWRQFVRSWREEGSAARATPSTRLGREFSAHWGVFSVRHKGSLTERPDLMQDGRVLGDAVLPGRLRNAIGFHRSCNDWLDHGAGEDESDSDWPDRPDLEMLEEETDSDASSEIG